MSPPVTCALCNQPLAEAASRPTFTVAGPLSGSPSPIARILDRLEIHDRRAKEDHDFLWLRNAMTGDGAVYLGVDREVGQVLVRCLDGTRVRWPADKTVVEP